MDYRKSFSAACRMARTVGLPQSGRGWRRALLMLLVLVGCRAGDLLRPPADRGDGDGDGNGTPIVPQPGQRLLAVSGDGQADSVGATLAQPFVVRIERASGAPVSGVAVAWRVVSGAGSITSVDAVSNAAGEARGLLTLGTVPGTIVVEASVASAEGGPARFAAIARPGAPHALRFEVDASDTQVNAPIRPALRVVLEDRFGNSISQASGLATIVLVEDTGTPLASAYGDLAEPFVAGRAEFSNVRIDLPGSGYRLRVVGHGLAAITKTFDVALLSAEDGGP